MRWNTGKLFKVLPLCVSSGTFPAFMVFNSPLGGAVSQENRPTCNILISDEFRI